MGNFNISVSVDKRKLQEIKARGGKSAARRALGKVAYLVESTAKDSMSGRESPSPPGEPPAVVTGNLRNSILAKAGSDGSREWWVRVGAEYGVYLEFGTAKMAARPFMRPAAERVRQAVDGIFEDELNRL